jgi:hypothetical protein
MSVTHIEKIKWASARVVAYSLGALVFFSGGTLLYIVAPLTSYFFFSDAAFWKNVKHFHKIYLSLIYFLRNAFLSWDGDMLYDVRRNLCRHSMSFRR